MTEQKTGIVAKHLTIKNMLGVKGEMHIDLGQITYFEGKNGTGKTTALQAIEAAVFPGSRLKEMRNINADADEEAEVVLHLDGEDGQQFVKRDEKKLEIKRQVDNTAAFKKVPRPADYLKEIVKGGIANPIKFIMCGDKERTQMLLEALPIEMNDTEMWSTIGLTEEDFPPVPDTIHPLEKISRHRQAIFEKRTGVNTSMRDKRATCEELRMSIPLEIPNVDGLSEKQEELAQLRERHAEGVAKIEGIADADVAKVDSDMKHTEDLATSEMETFRADVMREASERIAEKQNEVNASLHQDRFKADERKGAIETGKRASVENLNKLLPKISDLTVEVTELQQQIKQSAQLQTMRDQADKFEAQAESLYDHAEKLSSAISALDKFKANLVSDLPIKGLGITDGLVTVDGVSWSLVNTAKQLEIAVQVILLRYIDSKFKPLFVDGVEALDSESLVLLEDVIRKCGAQAFIGRVTDTNKIRMV